MKFLQVGALPALLAAMSDAGTLFVLGAGASAPDRPPLAGLFSQLRDEFMRLHLGYLKTHDGPLNQRIFPHDGGNWRDLDGDLDFTRPGVSPQTIRFEIHRRLEGPPDEALLPQYLIFRLVPPLAQIVNYNNDGLASRSCRQPVLEMHGSVVQGFTARLAERVVLRELYYWLQMEIEIAPRMLYPEPEPASFAVSSEVRQLEVLLHLARSVVVVGYSGGILSKFFDDRVSFRVFRDTLRGRRIPVFVIDPRANELEEAFRDQIRGPVIVPLGAYWKPLCTALLAEARLRGLSSLVGLDHARVIQGYHRVLGEKGCGWKGSMSLLEAHQLVFPYSRS